MWTRRCPCFFFSSRRRHTRFDCDWSSDVCSSDLYTGAVLLAAGIAVLSIVDREVAGRAQRTVETQARAVATQTLRRQVRASDFAHPVSPARRRQLDRLFLARILIPGVVGGRLVNADGVITYAALHSLIGTKVSYTTELQRVLAGRFARRGAPRHTWAGEPRAPGGR